MITANTRRRDASRVNESNIVQNTTKGSALFPSMDIEENTSPRVFKQRWVQLSYLSMLALLSDWVCFSTASNPEAFEEFYGVTSASLITKFLIMNVISCFCVTDIVAKFGLRRCIRISSILMTLGCWLRSGLAIIPMVFHDLLGWNNLALPEKYFGLVSYPIFVTGTLMVGAAQPFFQCTPPLLSAKWFASNERATSTAVALNFNQIGIATAFVVGGKMATTTSGLKSYFSLIAILSTLTTIGTFLQFESHPSVPPSTSELTKILKNEKDPPFLVSVGNFFNTKGFARPLAAFIFSITVTNIVGAFIDEVMKRGGITERSSIAWAGFGFEVAIVLGGIILGQYVDHTKSYKSVTLICIVLSFIFVIPLGLTDHSLGKEPVLLVVSLFALGFFTGPIQPINAELAVDVTYPSDETAVESVQQIGGNLISALFVPLAEKAQQHDYQLFRKIPLLACDIRGDVILLMILSVITYCFFYRFNASLRRTMADRNVEEGLGKSF